MKKEEIKRDKNGRFVKKSVEQKKAAKAKKDVTPKCEFFVFSDEGKGKNPDEYIKQLEGQVEMFKQLAERFASDYLNKCAEVAELKETLKGARGLRDFFVSATRSLSEDALWCVGNLSFQARNFNKKRVDGITDDAMRLLMAVKKVYEDEE